MRLDSFSVEKYSHTQVGAERPEILGSFRRYGLRCTSQRYAIFDYLLKHPSHPTAEQIHQAINRKDPRASLATVYKALHALAQAGMIREVNLVGNATRFESHTERHHHFVCEGCGRIEDFEWFDLPDIATRASADPRTVRSWELVLHGLCEICLSLPKEKLKWAK